MARVLLLRCPFPEAHVTRIALERAGLEVELRGAMRSGLFGAAGLEDAASELWIDESFLVRAKQVLDEVAKTPVPTEEWACARCGEKNPVNFQICWRCQASMKDGGPVEILPAKEIGQQGPPGPSRLPTITALLAVVVIGLSAALSWAMTVPRYLEAPGVELREDGDGCVVERVGARRRSRWCDANENGVTELSESFDRADRLTQRYRDANEDGNFELSETFDTAGRVISRYHDDDEDGLYERVEDLDRKGQVRRVSTDADGDGRHELVDETLFGTTRYLYREVADLEYELEVRTAGGAAHTYRRTGDGWR